MKILLALRTKNDQHLLIQGKKQWFFQQDIQTPDYVNAIDLVALGTISKGPMSFSELFQVALTRNFSRVLFLHNDA